MNEASKPDQEVPRERVPVTELFREAWSMALIKVGAAEEEAGRILHRAGELAGWGPEEVRRLAKEFGERLSAQRREYERSIDQGIERAVARLKLPRREEIDALRARLAALEERLDALQSREPRRPL